MADQDLLAIVWGEISGLAAKDRSDQTLARLEAVVAKLAAAAKRRSLDGSLTRKLAPRANEAQAVAAYSALTSTVNAVESDIWRSDVELPARAVLWEINENGMAPRDRAPPKSVAWIFESGTTHGGDFVAGSGQDARTYRLFESATSPTQDELPYLSGYTGSGISAAAAAAKTVAQKRRIAWILGSISAAVFAVGGVSAIWSGQDGGAARSQIEATGQQYAIVDKLADNCIADARLFPNWKRRACDFLDDGSGKLSKPQAQPAQSQQALSSPTASSSTGTPAAPTTAAPQLPSVISYDQRVGQTVALIKKCLNLGGAPLSSSDVNPPSTPQQAPADATADEAASCDLIARSAASVVIVTPTQSSLDGFVHSLLGLQNVAGMRSVIVQLLALTLGIAGLAVALGLGTKERLVGIWVDERNRVSLARAQVTLWTIVALGGFAAIAMYNIGLGAPVTFPRIPTSIIAALGIAFGSPMLSALILDRQPKSSPLGLITSIGQMPSSATDFADREVQADASKVESRALPSDASLADVFVGEHVADSNQVDISRLQNVVLTVTLVLGYFAMLLERLGSIAPESLLSGLSTLPDPGATFTSVLLVSHATYLGTKAYASTGVPQNQH